MHQLLLSEFTSAADELVSLLFSLNEDQLNKIPFEGSWTAGQVGHHLLKSYGVAKILNGNTAPAKRPADEKIREIKKVFLNFEIKMKSPEFIVPSSDHIEKEKLINGIKSKMETIKNFLGSKPDLTLICLDTELPGTGNLTRQEWIRFMTIHTQRHIHQLKKIIGIVKT
jgi:hypothetical protein